MKLRNFIINKNVWLLIFNFRYQRRPGTSFSLLTPLWIFIFNVKWYLCQIINIQILYPRVAGFNLLCSPFAYLTSSWSMRAYLILNLYSSTLGSFLWMSTVHQMFPMNHVRRGSLLLLLCTSCEKKKNIHKQIYGF